MDLVRLIFQETTAGESFESCLAIHQRAAPRPQIPASASQPPALLRESPRRVHLDLRRLAHLRAKHRRKFQRTHAARAGVAEALHSAETLRRPPLRRQPSVNEGIAKLVRQRIRQQPRQPVKRTSRQRWKLIHPLAQRHYQRRKLDSAACELRVILKRRHVASGIERHRADGAAPELNVRDHADSAHIHFLRSPPAVFLPVARCRFRPCCLSCVIGPAVGSGTSVSKRSSKPSVRQRRWKAPRIFGSVGAFATHFIVLLI